MRVGFRNFMSEGVSKLHLKLYKWGSAGNRFLFVILLVSSLCLWNTAKAYLDLDWCFEIMKENQGLFGRGIKQNCWNLSKDVTLL